MRSCTKFRQLLRSLFLVWITFAVHKNLVTAVTISSIQVPASVENGSESGALLDCLYTLDSREHTENSGLVVKWFFNRSLKPIYQWIHNQKPRDAGIFKGRLKLDYKASNNHSSMYRAMKIMKPTFELSGEYTCLVSTYHDEDYMIKSMIVFVPERRMDFFHGRHDFEKINVSCRVEGVYPKPILYLYKDNTVIDNVTVDLMKGKSGTYDMITSAVFSEEALTPPTVFDCELQIPGTIYQKRKTTAYFPESMKRSANVNETAVVLPIPILYVALAFALWFTNFQANQNVAICHDLKSTILLRHYFVNTKC